jgi:pyridoxine 5-phosphate synthase
LVLLGVNVDHVATIRQARGTSYPDPVESAICSIRGGADQITIHLREDRRHIQDSDFERMKSSIQVPLNLEMAASEEILKIALNTLPDTATLVPEKREELTTEGGLDVNSSRDHLKEIVSRLTGAGITVSMFIDPDIEQIDATLAVGTNTIELHTGRYCDALDDISASRELERLMVATRYAAKAGMRVCAGHGLNYENTSRVVEALPAVVEYNIGHSIIARSIRVGIERAVHEMKNILEGRV